MSGTVVVIPETLACNPSAELPFHFYSCETSFVTWLHSFYRKLQPTYDDKKSKAICSEAELPSYYLLMYACMCLCMYVQCKV